MFSGIGIVDMQNSISGRTFSRNAYGTYTKTRIGAPAGSAFLTTWQNVIAGLRFDWINIMTDTDRLKWYKYYIPRKNNMSKRHSINGFLSYMSCNENLALLSLPPIYTPPASYNAPVIPPFFIIDTTGLSTMKITLNSINTFDTAVYLSNQKSAGVMSLNQIFAFMGIVPAGTLTTNFYTTFFARYGPTISGKKVFAKICSIDSNKGTRSSFQYTGTTII